MKINELINEALMNPKIKKILINKGYKFLGHGQDQDAYVAPDGTILKIFGFEEGSKGLSVGQQSFVDFANFCMKNSNNPFLPQFGGWQQFEFEGERYLQIKCERLFDFTKVKAGRLAIYLEDFVGDIISDGPKDAIRNLIRWNIEKEYNGTVGTKTVGALVMLLGGEDKLQLFAETVFNLRKLARSKGYRLDLHSGNFMLTSEGDIIINDPFFTGTWR